MKNVNYQGRKIEAEELDVLTSNEYWNEYQLSDGSIISIKLVLTRVFKALHEHTAEGESLYMIQSQNIVKVNTPPEKM